MLTQAWLHNDARFLMDEAHTEFYIKVSIVLFKRDIELMHYHLDNHISHHNNNWYNSPLALWVIINLSKYDKAWPNSKRLHSL